MKQDMKPKLQSQMDTKSKQLKVFNKKNSQVTRSTKFSETGGTIFEMKAHSMAETHDQKQLLEKAISRKFDHRKMISDFILMKMQQRFT
jgi:hypothetical protein